MELAASLGLRRPSSGPNFGRSKVFFVVGSFIQDLREAPGDSPAEVMGRRPDDWRSLLLRRYWYDDEIGPLFCVVLPSKAFFEVADDGIEDTPD